MSQQEDLHPVHDSTGNTLGGFLLSEFFSRIEDPSLSLCLDLKINTLPCKAFDVSDSQALPMRVSERVSHTEVFTEPLLIIPTHLDGS